MTPKRQRKADRLISPGASATEIRCDYALAPFDRLSRQMDTKWGIDRLPELVSVETAEKFGSAMAKLNSAIDSDDPEQVKARAQVCMRGLTAMDAEASAAGHPVADPEIWQHEFDGLKFGIIRDGAEWKAAKALQPDLVIFTMQEIAAAMKFRAENFPAVQAVKEHFPQAEITGWRQDLDAGGDPIPELTGGDK